MILYTTGDNTVVRMVSRDIRVVLRATLWPGVIARHVDGYLVAVMLHRVFCMTGFKGVA